jgi:hypothetical protein
LPRGDNLPKVRTKATQAKGGRARAAKLRADREELERLAREKLEDALDRAAGVFVEALEAEGVVVVGTGEDAAPHYFPLHAVRIRAADKVFDRIIGRPVQAIRHSGPDGGPLEVEVDVRSVLRGLADRGLIRPGPRGTGDAKAK